MDQWTRLDPIFDSEAAARDIAAAAALRADAQDHDAGFPQEDIADLARLGLLAAPVPVEHGGAGLGTEPGAGTLAEVLRLVGYGSLALGRLYEGHVNALQLIARYGAPTSGIACSPTRMPATSSGSGTRNPLKAACGSRPRTPMHVFMA